MVGNSLNILMTRKTTDCGFHHFGTHNSVTSFTLHVCMLTFCMSSAGIRNSNQIYFIFYCKKKINSLDSDDTEAYIYRKIKTNNKQYNSDRSSGISANGTNELQSPQIK